MRAGVILRLRSGQARPPAQKTSLQSIGLCHINDVSNRQTKPLPAKAGRFLRRLKVAFPAKAVVSRLKPAEATALRRPL